MKCSLCGRKLSNGKSKGRGLGPECAKRLDSFNKEALNLKENNSEDLSYVFRRLEESNIPLFQFLKLDKNNKHMERYQQLADYLGGGEITDGYIKRFKELIDAFVLEKKFYDTNDESLLVDILKKEDEFRIKEAKFSKKFIFDLEELHLNDYFPEIKKKLVA